MAHPSKPIPWNLSAALAAMISLGAILGLNLHASIPTAGTWGYDADELNSLLRIRGWPLVFQEWHLQLGEQRSYWDNSAIAVDASILIFATLLVFKLTQIIARRRALP
jgi:hypothetical protein